MDDNRSLAAIIGEWFEQEVCLPSLVEEYGGDVELAQVALALGARPAWFPEEA